MTYILDSDRTIVTGDFNAHHHMWYSPMTDHRGTLIADKINNSDHLTLNTDSHTRHPTNRNQQPTSSDISTATNTIHNNITWTTLDAINSDHKPITILYKIKAKFKLTQNRLSYTNYKKAEWTNFARQIEGLLNANDIQDVHTGNKILTNLILEADKHNIPKGKQRQHNKNILPDGTRQLIIQRDQIKTTNPLDERLEDLNKQISRSIQDYRTKL